MGMRLRGGRAQAFGRVLVTLVASGLPVQAGSGGASSGESASQVPSDPVPPSETARESSVVVSNRSGVSLGFSTGPWLAQRDACSGLVAGECDSFSFWILQGSVRYNVGGPWHVGMTSFYGSELEAGQRDTASVSQAALAPGASAASSFQSSSGSTESRSLFGGVVELRHQPVHGSGVWFGAQIGALALSDTAERTATDSTGRTRDLPDVRTTQGTPSFGASVGYDLALGSVFSLGARLQATTYHFGSAPTQAGLSYRYGTGHFLSLGLDGNFSL